MPILIMKGVFGFLEGSACPPIPLRSYQVSCNQRCPQSPAVSMLGTGPADTTSRRDSRLRGPVLVELAVLRQLWSLPRRAHSPIGVPDPR